MTSSVVITGGSGVVGSSLIQHLVQEGVSPRALSRSDRSDDALGAIGAVPVRGDVLDPASLAEAFDGADLVYHVAGVNEMCAEDTGPMYRTNIEGSRNVVTVSREVGVGRLVYTSSAATIGEPPGAVGSELTVHRGWYLSDYERSKHLAEQVVAAEARGLDVVFVNPSSVQGPGRATGTGKIILDLVNGHLPVLVDTRVSIVDIDDCARAHLLAASHGRSGRRYLVNSFTMGIDEAITLVGQILGRRLRVRLLPSRVLGVGGAVADLASRLGLAPMPLCREMVETLRHGHAYDGSRAERELGLQYTSPEQTMSRLIDWFRTEGLLDA